MATDQQSRSAGSAGAALRLRALYGILVFVLAALVYAGTLRFDLAWDDTMLTALVEERARQGGLVAVLGSDFRLKRNEPTGFHRPLVLLSLWADRRLPLPVNVAHHIQNLLLHAAASALVYALLAQLLRSPPAALAGAALFAAHPVHVESVAFVSGRTDLLCAVFVFAAALFWERVRSGGTGRPRLETALSAGALFLAAISKETAFVLPAALLAWDLCDVRPGATARPNRVRRNALWLLGWAIALGAALALRALAGSGFGSGGEPAGLWQRVWMVAHYARLLLVPWPLNSWYTAAQVGPTVLGAACLVAFVGASLAAAGTRHGRIGLKALIWTAAFLAPVLGFVPFHSAPIAERFLYIPSFGLCAIFGWFVALPAPSRPVRKVRATAAALVVTLLALLCVLRAKTWENETTLFLAMTRSSPEAAIGHDGLGTIAQRRGDFEEALRHYRTALEKDPKAHATWDNLGNTLAKLGRNDEAISAYRAGLSSRPDSPLLNFNLALALARAGKRDESISRYRESLRFDPDDPETLNNLAWALAAGGKPTAQEAREAVALAARACALTANREPQHLDTLAAAHAAAGDLRAARETAQRALAAARAQGDLGLEAEILQRLEGYRDGPP